MKKRTILVVEDDPDDELLLMMALKDNGIESEVAVVRDGVEALDFLFSEGKHTGRHPDMMPCLILLDLKLPKMNGIEVLRHIRGNERTRVIPVVVLASSGREEDMIDCYRLCANSYLQKPMDYNEFVDAVRQLGAYWLKLNKLPEEFR